MNANTTLEPARHWLRKSVHPFQLRWVLVVGDLVFVNLAALLSLWFGVQRSPWWLAVLNWEILLSWFVFLSTNWWWLAEVHDLYSLHVAVVARRASGGVCRLVLGILLIYLLLYFLAAPRSLPRHLILFFAAIAIPILSLWRVLAAATLSSDLFKKRVLVIGAGESERVLLDAIRENAAGHYELVRWDHSAQHLLPIVLRDGINEIVLARVDDSDQAWLGSLMECRVRGIPIRHLAEVYEHLTGRVPLDYVSHASTIFIPHEREAARRLAEFSKRVVDVLCAAVGLVMSAPLWLLIGLAIRLDSPGPMLLRQVRVGKAGRHFELLKFRTMIAEAEEHGIPVWAAENDPRVTRVGRLLRRLRLDELPQFVNVLKGEMSIVGPRPERPEIVRELERKIPLYRIRHIVRPGLTGWAAINFGYARSVDDARVKLEYDLYYIKHQSLSLDLLILAKTLGSIWSHPPV